MARGVVPAASASVTCVNPRALRMACRRSPKLVSPYFFLGIASAIVKGILKNPFRRLLDTTSVLRILSKTVLQGQPDSEKRIETHLTGFSKEDNFHGAHPGRRDRAAQERNPHRAAGDGGRRRVA